MISNFLRNLYGQLKEEKAKRIALHKVKSHKGTTYFPEQSQKSLKTQKKELKTWAKKYREYNEFYTLYGFDVSNENQDDYQDYRSFMLTRNKANSIGGSTVRRSCCEISSYFSNICKAVELTCQKSLP